MRRIISFVMSIVMVFSMIPNGAFATVVEDEPIVETTAVTEAPAEQEEAPATQAPSEEAPAETPAATEAPTEAAPEETTAPVEPTEETVSEPAETEEAAAETVAEETEAEEIQEEIQEEISEVVIGTEALPDDGSPMDTYLNWLFYGNETAYLGEAAREHLTALEQEFYDVLKPVILSIAAGERASTVISVTNAQMTAWDTDVTLTFNTTSGQIAHDSFMTQLSTKNVINALMHDCPYEMYWYDKTVGTIITSSCSISGSQATITKVDFKFRVAGDMQPTGYDAANPTIVTTGAAAATAAAQNAQSIVEKYRSYGDYEKLVAYKEEICSLVTYNKAAAGNTQYTADIDPWQLLYVFDGDPDTNVVCEGYSKAFQYLFDESSFQGAVECYTVTGNLSGGGHMWNIVTIGGKNYLADVTNSDSGTAGAAGGLFLAGAEGSVSDGYTFLGCEFTYSDNSIALLGEDVLTLASTDYASGDEALGGTVTDAKNETYLQDLIGSGESWVTVSENVVLQNDFEISSGVSMDVEATITVPSGKTLTISSRVDLISGGAIHVEEGGKLVVCADIWCFNGGTLDVDGSYEIGQAQYGAIPGIIFNYTVEENAPIIDGIDNKDIRLQFLIYSDEDFSNALSVMEDAVYGKYILSIRESITLPGDVTIPASCVVHLESNELTLTIPEGCTLTNNGWFYIWYDQSLENNGAIVNNGGFWVYGKLTNNGTVTQGFNGSLETPGTWEGDAPIVPAMTQDDLEAAMEQAIANGYSGYTLNAPVTLERDLTVGNFWIGDGGCLTVPEGVKITVQNGLSVNPGGTLDVQGTYELLTNEYGWTAKVELQQWSGVSGSVNGVADEDIMLVYYVNTADDMGNALDALESSPYGSNNLLIHADATLDRDLTLGETDMLHLNNGATLTIEGGYTLVNNGEIYIWQGQTLVNDGTIDNNGYLGVMGTLNNNGETKISAGGYMVVDPTGTLNNDGTVTAPSSANVDLLGTLNGNPIVYKQDEFLAGLEEEGGYWTDETLTLTSDMTIPAGKSAEFGYEGETGALIVSNGVTLTVEGNLTFSGGATLTVKSGGKLVVAGNGGITMIGGALTIEDGGSYTIGENASIYASTPTVLNGIPKSEVINSGLLMDSSFDLAECLKEGEGYKEYLFDVYTDYTISEDITLDSNIVLGTYEYTITITNGATVTLNGTWNVGNNLDEETPMGGRIVVENGTLVNNGTINLIAGSTLEQNPENGAVINNGTIQGDVIYSGMTQAELEAAIAENDGLYFLSGTANITSDMTLSDSLDVMDAESKLYIHEGATLTVTGDLSVSCGATLIVKNGATLTVEGKLNVRDEGTTLIVQKGGKLVVTDTGSVNASGGTLTIEDGGSYTFGENASIYASTSTVLNGIPKSEVVSSGELWDSSASLAECLKAGEGYKEFRFDLTTDYTISEDITLDSNIVLGTYEHTITITNGATVTLNGTWNVGNNLDEESPMGGTLVVEDGTLVNNGTLNLLAGSNLTLGENGTLTNNGAVNGDMTQEAFEAALRAAEASGENLAIWNKIYVYKDLTVNMTGELSFADYSKLVVLPGVTLTLNCPTIINGAELTVEKGGKLVSNVNLSIVAPLNTATFNMNGEFVNNGQFWVNEGATANINGTASSTGSIFVGFGGNGETSTLNLNGTLSTSGYLCIADAGAPGELNVAEGAVLNILNNENGCGYLDNTGDVYMDGTLNLDGLFTCGAPRDEEGNLVGDEAYVSLGSAGVINASDTSTLAALDGGRVLLCGTVTSYGECVVDGGWMEVNHGTLTSYGVVKANEESELRLWYGTMNIDHTEKYDGVLFVYGDMYISAGSTLNIYAHAVVDGRMEIAANGTAALTTHDGSYNGTMEINPNGTLENSGSLSLVSDSYIENYGTLTNNGTLYNDGSIFNYGTYNANGSVEGNAPEDFKQEFLTALEAANANGGEVTINSNLYLNENLTVGSNVVVKNTEYTITLAEGMELTLDGTWIVGSENNAGNLVVDGAGLRVNGELELKGDSALTVQNESTMAVNGTVTIPEGCYLFLTEWSTLNVNDDSTLTVGGTVRNGEGSQISIDGGNVTVTETGLLDIRADLQMNQANVTIRDGGKLEISKQGYVGMYGGTLTVENPETGYSHKGYSQYLSYTPQPDSQIIGVEPSQIFIMAEVNDLEELTAALKSYAGYAYADIDITSDLTFADNFTLPKDMSLSIRGEGITVTISDGVTVTLNGSMNINGSEEMPNQLVLESGAKLIINNYFDMYYGAVTVGGEATNNGWMYVSDSELTITDGGILTNEKELSNQGTINVNAGGTLINNGTVTNRGTLNVDDGAALEQNGTWKHAVLDTTDEPWTQEEFEAALVTDTTEQLMTDRSLTLTSDLVIPAGDGVCFQTNAEVIVPGGMTLTVEGELILHGTLTIEAGGKLVLADGAMLSVYNGTLTIAEGGSYAIGQDATVFMSSYGQINGIPTGEISSSAEAGYDGTLAELAEKAKAYKHFQISLQSEYVITEDVVLGENVDLVHFYWTTTIAEGATLTLNGTWDVGIDQTDMGGGWNPGYIVIADGELINNGTINLDYGSTLTVDPDKGELTNNGTINGMETAEDRFLEDLAAAEASGENLVVRDQIILTKDLTINMTGELQFADYSKLVVSNGVTLTLNTATSFNEGELVVKKGGKLITNVNLTFNAPTIGLGKATIDGELENNGVIWINTGSTMTINGTAVSYYQPIHVGFAEGGTLNVNGSLTTYGYLNVGDTLNVSGTLTVNKDETGCGFLQAGGTVNVSGTLNANGGVTIGNEDGTSVMTIEEDGILNVEAEWFEILSGELIVDGRANVKSYIYNENGTITKNGIWNGFDAIPIIDQAAFEAILADAKTNNTDARVKARVILSEDMTITLDQEKCLYVQAGGEIVVPEGVTLTLNGSAILNFGGIRVEQGGKLVNGGSMNVMEGGLLTVEGEFENNDAVYISKAGNVVINGTAINNLLIYIAMMNGGSMEVNGTLINNSYVDVCVDGELIVNGALTNKNEIAVHGTLSGSGTVNNELFVHNYGGTVNFTGTWNGRAVIEQMDQAAFEAMLAEAAANNQDVFLNASVNLTKDLIIDLGERELSIQPGAELIVQPNVTLTLNSAVYVNDGRLLVSVDGKLINNKNLTINANEADVGSVIITGDMENYGVIWINTGSSMTINGTAVSYYEPIHVGFAEGGILNVVGSLTTYGYLNAGDVLNVAGTLTIAKSEIACGFLQAGGTVNVTGTLNANGGVTIGNDEGTSVMTIAKDGTMNVEAEWFDILSGKLIVDGTANVKSDIYNENGTVTVNGTWNGNPVAEKMTQDDFQRGLEAAVGDYEVTGRLTLTDNLTIPAGKTAAFQKPGNLVVPEGTTLTVEGNLLFFDTSLTVEKGGKLIVSGKGNISMMAGVLTIEEGAEYTIGEDASIYATVGTQLNGITKGEVCNSNMIMDPDTDLEAFAEEWGAGYKKFYLSIYTDYTVSRDMTLDSNIVLDHSACTVTITNGATLTINGPWKVGLDLSSEGYGVTAGHIKVEDGTLVINDEMVLIGDSTVTVNPEKGAVINNGTIQGDITYTGMTQAQLEAAIAASEGEYTLTEVANITSDMTLNNFLRVEEGGKLFIHDGATLTLDNIVQLVGGGMTICSGGKVQAAREDTGIGVINSGVLEICSGATLDLSAGTMGVDGGIVNAETGATVLGDSIEINPLDSSINGIPTSKLTISMGAQDETSLKALLDMAPEYKAAKVYISADFDLTQSVILPANAYMEVHAENFRIADGGRLTVCGNVKVNSNIYVAEGGSVGVSSGGCITVSKLMQIGGGEVIVSDGGKIVMEENSWGLGVFEGGSLYICSGGTLDVTYGTVGVESHLYAEEGAIVLGNGIEVNYYEASLNGVPHKQVMMVALASSNEQLDETLAAAENFYSARIIVPNDMEIAGKMTVPANTSLLIMSTNVSIAADAKLTVNGTLVVEADNTLTNNGILYVTSDGRLWVNEGAVLNNQGETYLANGAELKQNGTWNGDDYILGQPEPETMSFADFKAAIADGWYELDCKVTIEETLDITDGLEIVPGGEIVVPSGVTLTVTYLDLYGGKITVEAGGTLVNAGQIIIENNGELTVNGNYVSEEWRSLEVYLGESSITGIPTSYMTLKSNVETEEDLRIFLAQTGYKNYEAYLVADITLADDLALSGLDLWVNSEAVLTVPENVKLSLQNAYLLVDGGLVVENGAALTYDDDSYVQIMEGRMTAGETAQIGGEGRLYVNFNYDAIAENVDPGLITAIYEAASTEELLAVLEAGAQYLAQEINIYDSFSLTTAVTIPATATVYLYDGTCLTVPGDVTLTNNGEIQVYFGGQLVIDEGGTLDNQGNIQVYADGGFVNNGTLLGKEPGESGGSGSDVYTLEELISAIESGEEYIHVYDSITLAENLSISAKCRMTIHENGEIVVPDGVTLTNNGILHIQDGKLTVQAGGAVENMRVMGVDGTITVDPEGSFTFGENGIMTVQYGSTVTGIDKSEYRLQYIAETEEELRTGLKLTGYERVTVSLAMDVTLTANLTIPEKANLTIGYYWEDEYTVTATLTVPSGKTITNNGALEISNTTGCLNIAEGGKLVNNGKFYVYGTLINNGTITGNGSMDYARPAYTYADLVGWLNADLVPTYIYVWGTVTLEGDITIPEGTQLIMEGSSLVVPSGCTVTVNGELYSQEGGVVTFQEGSKLINNNWVEAYKGTINIFGEYQEANEDIILMLYPDSAINGVDNKYVYYMVSFNDEASLVAALNKVEQEGYGEASVYVEYGCGVVEVTGNVTVPENVYLQMGAYYGDSMVLKSGAVLTVNGDLYVYEPGNLIVENGAQLITNGYVEAYEGGIVYLGGDITISAAETELYGKEKLTLSAAITPEVLSGAKITWELAEGDETYATIKGSGSKATVTAADVTDEQVIEVIASATLSNGAAVSDTVAITIHPLVKQITIEANGEDVTGQTIKYDLNYVPEGETEAQRTLDLTALVMPGKADQKVNWTTTSAAIATVDAEGQVTFTDKGGKVTITATATDNSKVSTKVTIQAVKLVQNITLLSGDTELVGGKGTTLKVQDNTDPGKALAASAVTWALADEDDAAYATVTAAGKVTTKVVQEHVQVVLEGTINDNPYADPIEVTLNIYPAVAMVDILLADDSVSGQKLQLDYSETLTLSAVQFPENVMGKADWDVTDKKGAVTYTEENNTLTLTPTGNAGTVTIKATATDGSKKSASVTVNVAKYVTSITVATDKAEWNGKLTGGETMNLTATVEPEGVTNAAVTWSFKEANDKSYVTLATTKTGVKVTAKKGLAMSKDITILATAKDGSGKVGEFTFTLLPSDPGVLTITRDSENVTGMTLPLDLNSNDTITLKAEYFEAVEGYAVTWKVTNATIKEQTATTVTIQATKAGTVTVKAVDKENTKKNATVKLAATYLSSGVEITSKTGFDVASGKALQLTATVQGKIVDGKNKITNAKVDWWIDEADTAYAKISGSGKITAAKNLVEKQTITVWAQAKDGNSEAVSETVTIHPLTSGIQIIDQVTDVELTNTTQLWDMVKDGTTLDLKAGVFPADALQAVEWKSSSNKIAEIDQDGVITIKNAGTVTITATAADGSGKKATFKLTVVRTVREITQTQTEAVLASKKTLNLAKLITVDKEATNKKVTWSMTGDTAFATLSASGALKAKAVTDVKTVYVTATAQDGSEKAVTFTVYIYPATTKVQIVHDGDTTLAVGDTLTLKGISTPAGAAQGKNAYTWKTSGAAYVDFVRDEDGNVVVGEDGSVTITGLKATAKNKTITITCTTADGTNKSATIKIKVS